MIRCGPIKATKVRYRYGLVNTLGLYVISTKYTKIY